MRAIQDALGAHPPGPTAEATDTVARRTKYGLHLAVAVPGCIARCDMTRSRAVVLSAFHEGPRVSALHSGLSVVDWLGLARLLFSVPPLCVAAMGFSDWPGLFYTTTTFFLPFFKVTTQPNYIPLSFN